MDLSPSTAIGSVTHVDTDAQTARFFADAGLVREELAAAAGPHAQAEAADARTRSSGRGIDDTRDAFAYVFRSR